MIKAVHYFQHFLKGAEFTILTDHKNLTTLTKGGEPHNKRYGRWIEWINEYSFTIKWVAGDSEDIRMADLLTRFGPSDEEMENLGCEDAMATRVAVMFDMEPVLVKEVLTFDSLHNTQFARDEEDEDDGMNALIRQFLEEADGDAIVQDINEEDSDIPQDADEKAAEESIAEESTAEAASKISSWKQFHEELVRWGEHGSERWMWTAKGKQEGDTAKRLPEIFKDKGLYLMRMP